jgi:hypothetical protein
MAIKKYYDNPKTTDTILFDLYTPQSDGCFLANPITFDSIGIFFISRSQVQQKDLVTYEVNYDPQLQRATYVATEEYCTEQDEQIKQELEVIKNSLQNRLENNANITDTVGNITFYSDAVSVYCAGTGCLGQDPIWIDGDTEYNQDSVLEWDTDDKEVPYGHFIFLWTPGIIKEGDYYICYSYTMRLSQYKTQKYTKYIHFYIKPNIQNEISVPSHGCPPEKYITLLNHYLPRMYLENWAKQDLSVQTLESLNASIAQVFTGLDDQASRIIDILNANDTPEPYLNYLAQMFQLTLRSNDLTRWRGQIITAVPQFKRKGTLESLAQAFSQAGIYLTSYYQYWQIMFPQVWTQTFKFTGSYEFPLRKYTNDDYAADYPAIFELKLATVGTNTWVLQSPTTVSFAQDSDNVTIMTWDETPSTTLQIGDIIYVTYVTEPLSSLQINMYEYWRDYLPLMDVRPFFLINAEDEIISRIDLQEPPFNWNVRLILPSNPMFDPFIPSKNPFTDPVVFGMIRTEFPYSENVYNMDEYNGSLRSSNNPVDMSADFEEPCSGTISAYYGLDIIVENLSDFRTTEVLGIIDDYTPFHSVLHTLNITGSIEEFTLPPVENIEWLMEYYIEDYFIAGDAQFAFNRNTLIYNFNSPYASSDPYGRVAFLRTDFAQPISSPITGSCTLYNKEIVIKALVPSVNLSNMNLNLTNNILEILDSSFYDGIYTNYIESTEPFSLVLTDVAASTFNGMEPIANNNFFTWRISNLVYSGTFQVSNMNQFTIYDENINLNSYNIQTINANGSANAWTVTTSTGTYKILYTNNNTIYLENGTPALNCTPASNFIYSVNNTQTSQQAYDSNTGVYNCCVIAKVTSSTFSLANFCIAVPSPDLYFSNDFGVNQYKFYWLDPDDSYSFYVSDYNVGLTPVTITAQIYNRLTENYGNFGFEGLYVSKGSNWPTLTNPDQSTGIIPRSALLPQNCILSLNLGTQTQDYILNVHFSGNTYTGNTLEILGYFVNAGTTATGSGVSCTYEFYEFEEIEEPQIVPNITGQTLYYVTRAGQEIWSYTVQKSNTYAFNMTSDEKTVSVPGKPVDFVKNTENINFVIEYKDGQKNEGDLNVSE